MDSSLWSKDSVRNFCACKKLSINNFVYRCTIVLFFIDNPFNIYLYFYWYYKFFYSSSIEITILLLFSSIFLYYIFTSASSLASSDFWSYFSCNKSGFFSFGSLLFNFNISYTSLYVINSRYPFVSLFLSIWFWFMIDQPNL